MPDFPLDMQLVVDPLHPENVVRGGSIYFYDPSDTAGVSPIAIKDPSGLPLPNPLTSNDYGFIQPTIVTIPKVKWKSGTFEGFFFSYDGLRNEAIEAKEAAQAAGSTAGAAAAADLASRIAAGQFKGDDGANGSNVLPTDTAIKDAINNSGSATRGALNATILDANDQPATSLLAALPRLMGTVASYNDYTAAPVRVIGMGSSVGRGPNGATDPVNAVSPYLTAKLEAALNRLGNLNIEHYNGAVSGSILTEGYTTHYADAKTAAGGVPALVTMAYGMNDGMPSQYHAGQTFPFVYSRTKQIIEAVRADGGDVIVLTTPHPHTETTPWTYAGTPTYPSATITPTGDYAGAVRTIEAPSGGTVLASYRHLRVNDAMRRAASELGAVIIDVERYWFDAVAKYGQDALYNIGQYNHPNLFGYQQSYHKAIDAFARSLVRPVVAGGAAPSLIAAGTVTEYIKRKVSDSTRTTTTLSTDSQLTFTAPANTVWMLEARFYYNVPTASDMRVGLEVPAGGSGTIGGIGAAQSSTTIAENLGSFRSSTTPTTTIAFGGNTSGSFATVFATVHAGSTGGTIGIQFGLDVAGGGTATIYANSTLVARQIT